jgi:hypothetical protein
VPSGFRGRRARARARAQSGCGSGAPHEGMIWALPFECGAAQDVTSRSSIAPAKSARPRLCSDDGGGPLDGSGVIRRIQHEFLASGCRPEEHP